VWSLDHPIATTIGLSMVIIIVVVPICVRRYSHSTR
jgi:hypothetical protein